MNQPPLPQVGFTLVALLFMAASEVAAEADNPNIIVLLADDLGYGELGCQGNEEIPTPHIDSIAANAHRYADQQHEKEAGHHGMMDGMSGDNNFDPDRRVMPRMAPVS